MRVLVQFRQEFYTKDSAETYKMRITENMSRVFDAFSDDDLLQQFDEWNYVPYYIRRLSNTTHKIVCGNKEMLWYLPEDGKPHINDLKAKYE